VGITGSMAGLVQVGAGGPAAYGASKYAVVGIAEALRAELGPSESL
jgi:NAD(P)-dependent dehydrogenase (short-subunit alcohol dehydrogenase family)